MTIREPQRFVMNLSLATSALMLAGKLTAYFVTHSVAIFADAAESLVHGVATGLAAFSLWYAAKPADKHHPYGHGRIAYFSAGFEGALVLAAALTVITQGISGLIWPPELRKLGVGIAISAGLMLVNLVLGTALIRVGRTHHSVVLIANGKHVLSDVWTTAAAIVGVGLVAIFGVIWLDSAAAIVLGVVILWTGASLIRASFGGLMDEVDQPLVDVVVKRLQSAVEAGEIADFHQLRCRRANDAIWVEVHMLVPGVLTVEEAHRRVTRVEESLRSDFAGRTIQITTHIEPRDHARAHPDGHGKTADPLTPASPRP